MHIKLINPRMRSRPSDTPIKFKLLPPQSLLLLGALTPDRHQVTLVDENVEGEACTDDHPDLVALPVFVATATRAYAIADAYRKKGVRVVLGGLHATSMPQEAKVHADSVVVGEADLNWPLLVHHAETGDLAPFYRNNQSVPLEQTPQLRRDLVDSRRYASVNALRTSRGCPNGCSYCYQSAFYPDRRVRHQRIDRIVDEVRSMKSRHVLLLDDNIIGDRAFARALFEALIPLRITWSGASTIGIGDHRELLELAYASGCRSLFIGFESLNQESLAQYGKRGNHVERFARQVDAIHQRGIMINGSFIFGMDHDDPGVFERTVDWIVRNRIETSTFHILTPYPGTGLYKQLESEGRIAQRDWDLYNTAHAVFRPAKMSPQELEQGYRWAYRAVYSWSNVVRRSPVVPSLRLPYWAFVLGYKKCGAVMSALSRLGLMEPVFAKLAEKLLQPGQGELVSPMLSEQSVPISTPLEVAGSP